MKAHPAADLLPPMLAEEYAGLHADIAANGQRHHRRSLTASQRAALAVDAEVMFAEQAAKRMKAGKKAADPTPDLEEGPKGHPQLRPEGHAAFCEPWNAANTLPALASTSSSTVPPAVSQGDVDGAASPRARIAVGEVGTAVGPSSPQLPGRSTHAKQKAPARTGAFQDNAG